MYFQLSISKISKILFFSTATTNSTCNLSGINHYTSEEIFSALRNSHLYPCHSITRSTTFCPFFCDLLPIFTWTSFALLYLFYTVKSIKLNIYYSLLMVTLSIHLLTVHDRSRKDIQYIHILFYHGHGLFLQFFWFFRSIKDLFTSAYNTRSQAGFKEYDSISFGC